MRAVYTDRVSTANYKLFNGFFKKLIKHVDLINCLSEGTLKEVRKCLKHCTRRIWVLEIELINHVILYYTNTHDECHVKGVRINFGLFKLKIELIK